MLMNKSKSPSVVDLTPTEARNTVGGKTVVCIPPRDRTRELLKKLQKLTRKFF
jgi:hypothetical protein